MDQEPTFKLAVELTANHVDALAEIVEIGSAALMEKIDTQSEHRNADIVSAHDTCQQADEVVTALRQALASDCNEILAMFGLGYERTQEAGQ